MKGFADKLLNDHFDLYQGSVTHTNALLEKLAKFEQGEKPESVEHSELRRRLGWEFDGMRLHELYFGNLGGNGKPPPEGMRERPSPRTSEASIAGRTSSRP
jgi:superoxide dismutase, Fe-Mn family